MRIYIHTDIHIRLCHYILGQVIFLYLSSLIINSLIIVAIVGDICAATPPTLTCLLGVDGRIHERSHAIIIQAIRFDQVHDGKPFR